MFISTTVIPMIQTGPPIVLSLVGHLLTPLQPPSSTLLKMAIGGDHDYLKKHFKARNPVLNIPWHHEPVATDTIFSDTPAVDHGGKMAQIFVGRRTLVCDAYGIKSTKQFVNTLQDNIRERGAMETLISDGGSALISNKVKDILRTLLIADYQSELFYQHKKQS
ncbi:hypothetical protein ACA910_009390 [Epithemia clementina (nom. ined.)]